MPQLTQAQITGPQTTDRQDVLMIGGTVLPSVTVDQIRRDPTIAMVRDVMAMTIAEAGWGLEGRPGVPDSWYELVHEEVDRHVVPILQRACYGITDHGWQGFELVWQNERARTRIRKIKPLRQSLSTILIDRHTGDFAGFRQVGDREVRVPPTKALIAHWEVDGDDLRGLSILSRVRETVALYQEAQESVVRYDAKIAGGVWVITYPRGRHVDPDTGEETDHADVAQRLADDIEASGTLLIPSHVHEYIESGAESGWKIERVESSPGHGAGFAERLNYLDRLKIRGFAIPERALLESHSGTRADAGTQTQTILPVLSARSGMIAHAVSQQVVNRLLAANFGPEARDAIWYEPAPLDDTRSNRLWSLVAEHPEGIDMDTVLDQLRLPRTPVDNDLSGE